MSSVDKSLKPAVEYGDLVTKLIHVMACDVSWWLRLTRKRGNKILTFNSNENSVIAQGKLVRLDLM